MTRVHDVMGLNVWESQIWVLSSKNSGTRRRRASSSVCPANRAGSGSHSRKDVRVSYPGAGIEVVVHDPVGAGPLGSVVVAGDHWVHDGEDEAPARRETPRGDLLDVVEVG